MSLEDIELENLNRIERLLIEKHGKLSKRLTRSIGIMREFLEIYEIDESTLDRVNDEMYKASKMDDVKEVEDAVKNLADTFWD